MLCSHRDLQAAVAADIECALPPLTRDRDGGKVGIQTRVTQLLALPEMQQVRQLMTGPLPTMTYLQPGHQLLGRQIVSSFAEIGFCPVRMGVQTQQGSHVAASTAFCSQCVAPPLQLTCAMLEGLTDAG